MSVRYRKERLDRGIKARCEDIFALSSYREMLYLLLPRVLPVIALLSLPLLKGVVGLYWEKVLVVTCAIALLALSWDLMASVGLVCLGQALFFGAGAYLTGFLNHSFGWPPFLTIPLGTLGGALFCTLLLLPVLRLRGIYFAIVTLTLPLLLARFIETTKILGGNVGMSGLSPLPGIWFELYVPVVALLICLFGFRRLINEDYGLVLQGIRDNDRAVMSGAINIYKLKAQAVFIAGVAGAFAGAFMTHYYQFVGMPAFALDYSILPLTCAVLGGVGSFAGPTLGAFILVPLSEILRAFGTLRVVFYSTILIICVVGLPEGIFHYIQRKYHQFERLVEVG
ncbi:MAG: branched-chain amino acid ABC transporter permease [Deltaproteobacteria bacterium]|nr:MAG: branched-chain amino acid ABC transporter permease [Deltaproteobacteria bacterium]